jgi:hypothetical protein
MWIKGQKLKAKEKRPKAEGRKGQEDGRRRRKLELSNFFKINCQEIVKKIVTNLSRNGKNIFQKCVQKLVNKFDNMDVGDGRRGFVSFWLT